MIVAPQRFKVGEAGKFLSEPCAPALYMERQIRGFRHSGLLRARDNVGRGAIGHYRYDFRDLVIAKVLSNMLRQVGCQRPDLLKAVSDFMYGEMLPYGDAVLVIDMGAEGTPFITYHGVDHDRYIGGGTIISIPLYLIRQNLVRKMETKQ